jgi:hypothetical protein
MATYDGDAMDETMPDLNPGEVEHIQIVHDETAVNANEYQGYFWLKHGEQVLKKKERGRLSMMSGFLCQRYGNLALTEELITENAKLPEGEQLAVTDSRITIHPTSKDSGDDYWNMDQMIAQVSASSLLEKTYLFLI